MEPETQTNNRQYVIVSKNKEHLDFKANLFSFSIKVIVSKQFFG